MANESATNNVFVFDLDETLFSISPERLNRSIRASLDPWIARKNYYPNMEAPFYMLFPHAMKKIMNTIISSGGKLAFVTAGKFTKEALIGLFNDEYHIQLDPQKIEFYNKQFPCKNNALLKIIANNPNAKIIYTDNSQDHIDDADNLYKLFQAITEHPDSYNDLTNKYIQHVYSPKAEMLRNLIKQHTHNPQYHDYYQKKLHQLDNDINEFITLIRQYDKSTTTEIITIYANTNKGDQGLGNKHIYELDDYLTKPLELIESSDQKCTGYTTSNFLFYSFVAATTTLCSAYMFT
ncbi:hypothetical protein L3V82_12085 [Thiotrichales bacterium 19S3-7]|nr:hypothetical protein [Thiotrichales bacterium 19S3-7]MCF6802933.1 hypothetical protein [Thiotrichales bacterium 19S3-11]